MDFLTAIKAGFAGYFDFKGRAIRSEFWYWVLFYCLVTVVLRFVDGTVIASLLRFAPFDAEAGQPLTAIVALLLLIPSLSVGARRLHDMGKSGWWQLLALIPIIGAIVLIYWFVQPSRETAPR